jgi:hypothetical protein
VTVKVKLHHLNIVPGRKPNTWYVYPRGGGKHLIKGFVGTREELLKKLAEPALLNTYNPPAFSETAPVTFLLNPWAGLFTGLRAARSMTRRKAR